jgi:predicted nucleotidyltransferase
MRRIAESDTITPADRELLSELKRAVLRLLPDATVLLYGSAATGTREPESDYDILVLVKTSLSTQEEDRVRGAVYDVALAHDVVFSLIFDTHEEWNRPLAAVTPYHANVERDGIVL